MINSNFQEIHIKKKCGAVKSRNEAVTQYPHFLRAVWNVESEILLC